MVDPVFVFPLCWTAGFAMLEGIASSFHMLQIPLCAEISSAQRLKYYRRAYRLHQLLYAIKAPSHAHGIVNP